MITAKQQKLLRQLGTRQGRKKLPYFICEGERCCREAIDRQADWIQFGIVCESYVGELAERLPNGERVPDRDFQQFTQTENPQGILLVLQRPDVDALPEAPSSCVLVLDRLADPGNVGTILRTAWAVGMNTVIWTNGTCDPFSAKAIRSGMGAQFALHLPRCQDLAAVRNAYPERRLWITAADGELSCFEPDFDLRNSLVVMGNEADGAAVLDGASRVRIPMPGDAESLNVAQAATVILFEALRLGNLE